MNILFTETQFIRFIDEAQPVKHAAEEQMGSVTTVLSALMFRCWSKYIELHTEFQHHVCSTQIHIGNELMRIFNTLLHFNDEFLAVSMKQRVSAH